MLWWVLALLGLTVLVLYAMVSRRHFTFLLAGLGLAAAGGLGIAGVFGGEMVNPIEAITRGFQDPATTQPAASTSPSTTPDTGSSVTPNSGSSTAPDSGSSGTPPTSPNPSSDPGSISSGITGMEPAPAPTPPTTEPPATPTSPEPSPPAAPEQPSPTTPSEPALPPAPQPVPPAASSPANTCPCTLEISTNTSVVSIKLTRDNGETLGSSGTPAKFDNLPAGMYTVTIEATGTRGYTGTVTLPQTRMLSVYLEQ